MLLWGVISVEQLSLMQKSEDYLKSPQMPVAGRGAWTWSSAFKSGFPTTRLSFHSVCIFSILTVMMGSGLSMSTLIEVLLFHGSLAWGNYYYYKSKLLFMKGIPSTSNDLQTFSGGLTGSAFEIIDNKTCLLWLQEPLWLIQCLKVLCFCNFKFLGGG